MNALLKLFAQLLLLQPFHDLLWFSTYSFLCHQDLLGHHRWPCPQVESTWSVSFSSSGSVRRLRRIRSRRTLSSHETQSESVGQSCDAARSKQSFWLCHGIFFPVKGKEPATQMQCMFSPAPKLPRLIFGSHFSAAEKESEGRLASLFSK